MVLWGGDHGKALAEEWCGAVDSGRVHARRLPRPKPRPSRSSMHKQIDLSSVRISKPSLFQRALAHWRHGRATKTYCCYSILTAAVLRYKAFSLKHSAIIKHSSHQNNKLISEALCAFQQKFATINYQFVTHTHT